MKSWNSYMHGKGDPLVYDVVKDLWAHPFEKIIFKATKPDLMFLPKTEALNEG